MIWSCLAQWHAKVHGDGENYMVSTKEKGKYSGKNLSRYIAIVDVLGAVGEASPSLDSVQG